jgi:hypothetical protein
MEYRLVTANSPGQLSLTTGVHISRTRMLVAFDHHPFTGMLAVGVIILLLAAAEPAHQA